MRHHTSEGVPRISKISKQNGITSSARFLILKNDRCLTRYLVTTNRCLPGLA